VGQRAVGAGRQLAADAEFINAKYTDVFTNSSLGWPAITSVNLPSSGPSPPLTALGVRLRANLTDNWTVSAAIFDGDGAGPGPEDPQLRDNHGVNFRINDPPLVIGEVQYIWNGRKGDPGLDGKFKLGGWRHFGDFSDQRFTAQGVSIANPFSSGMPANLLGISASIRCSSRRSIASAATTTGASEYSPASHPARRTET
jgi:porin